MKTPDTHLRRGSNPDREPLRASALFLAAVLTLQIGAAPAVGCAAADDERKAEDSKKDGEEQSEAGAEPEAENEAGSEEAGSDSAAKALAEGQRVFTNDDLRRYRRVAKATKPTNIVVDMTRPKPGEPGAEQAGAMDPAERQRRLEAIREEMRQADERIKVIDARTRSLHNPFLPRPKVSEEEKAAEAGMDARQIVEALAAERAEIQARLAELKAELEALSRTPAAGAEGAPPAGAATAPEKPAGEAPAPEPPRP